MPDLAEIDVLERMSEVRRYCISHCPQISSIAMWMPHIYTTDNNVAATDGNRLYFGALFWDILTIQERAFVYLHEMLHVASRHIQRRTVVTNNPSEYLLWNIACDAIINDALHHMSWLIRPKNCIIYEEVFTTQERNSLGDAHEVTPEHLFEILKKRPKPPTLPKGLEDLIEAEGNGSGNAIDSEGGSSEGNDKAGRVIAKECEGTEMEDNSLSDHLWASRMAQARQGDRPGGLFTRLKDIPQPKTNWKVLLRNLVGRELSWKRFSSYAKSSRRGIALQTMGYSVIIPGFQREPDPPEVVVCMDLSGSCFDQDTVEQFAGEIAQIRGQTGASITLITFDAEVQDVFRFAAQAGGEPFIEQFKKLELHGGGGTSFIPLFDSPITDRLGKTHTINPKVMVVLTDMYGSFPPTTPKYPVIWATMTKGYDQPFGQIVEID